MKGIIKINTPAIEHQISLETGTQLEIYDKCRQLKEDIFLEHGSPFMVWVQLPSSMNNQNIGKDR